MKTNLRSNHAFRPRHFGRGRSYVLAADQASPAWSDDVRLFATTFAAGFLFVSLYLA